jgi:hypothetical protein
MTVPPFALGVVKNSPWIIAFHGQFLAFTLRPNPKHSDLMDIVVPSTFHKGCLEATSAVAFAALKCLKPRLMLSGAVLVEAMPVPAAVEIDGGFLDLASPAEPVYRSCGARLVRRLARWNPLPGADALTPLAVG